MKIIQITDLHIDKENEFPFDINVRKNFKRILPKQRYSVLSFLNPGFLQSPLIQISGRWLHSLISEIKFKLLVIVIGQNFVKQSTQYFLSM